MQECWQITRLHGGLLRSWAPAVSPPLKRFRPASLPGWCMRAGNAGTAAAFDAFSGLAEEKDTFGANCLDFLLLVENSMMPDFVLCVSMRPVPCMCRWSSHQDLCFRSAVIGSRRTYLQRQTFSIAVVFVPYKYHWKTCELSAELGAANKDLPKLGEVLIGHWNQLQNFFWIRGHIHQYSSVWQLQCSSLRAWFVGTQQRPALKVHTRS